MIFMRFIEVEHNSIFCIMENIKQNNFTQKLYAH